MAIWRPGGVYGDANFARIYGVDPEVAAAGQPLGHYVNSIHPEDAPVVRAEVQKLYEGGDEFIHEHRIVRPDGELRWVVARGRLVRNAAGQPVRFVGASVDITDRRMAEERQRLLMEELAHRVKNMLTVVQAIASQTLRGSGVSPEAREVLSKRLMALSRAHDLLMQGQWSEASLLALVEGTARLHAHGEAERFRIAGPEITLGSRTAMAMALVLHELATNAVKYGALSVPEGQVLAVWETVELGGEPRLRFRWEEVGGPACGAADAAGVRHPAHRAELRPESGRGNAARLPGNGGDLHLGRAARHPAAAVSLVEAVRPQGRWAPRWLV